MPIAISAMHARMKTAAPTLPTKRLPTKPNSPVAKTIKRNPLTTSPLLKTIAVMPLCTPKSLKALFVQLNCGQEAIANRMHANAKKGAAKPMIPEILSCLLNSQTFRTMSCSVCLRVFCVLWHKSSQVLQRRHFFFVANFCCLHSFSEPTFSTCFDARKRQYRPTPYRFLQ